MKITILVCIFYLLLASYLEARIIDVPDEFRSIRAAIHDTDDGDTVLVQPGTYTENINFEGKAITVASLIIITGDTAYIDSTVIDGNGEGSVVRFDHEEDENSILTGFTLTNGSGSPDISRDLSGGGIHCFEASPRLTCLKVIGNSARYGGGVFLQYSSPHISNVIVSGNRAERGGGGVYFSRESSPLLTYTSIHENESAHHGGGVGCYLLCRPRMVNVTIARNRTGSEQFGAISFFMSNRIDLINAVIWGNEPAYITYGIDAGSDTLSISYSDIEGGEESIQFAENRACDLIWHDENIAEDPLFVDPDNSDFHLQEDSPCIDAGDPESPDDPDETRADMGAFPFLRFFSVLQGFVSELEDNSPLAEATVATSHGFSAQTDEDGFWQIDPILSGDFDLSANKTGYIDSTLIDFHIDPSDTLEVIFQLRNPEFTPSVEELDAELELGDSTRLDFTVRNTGNGSLTWSVERRMHGVTEPWEIIRPYQFGLEVNDSDLRTVAFINDQFWITNRYNVVYIFNREGQLVNGPRNLGRVLGWDGEFIWMVRSQNVFSMDLDGEINESWRLPFEVIDGIWDGDRNLFWIAGENLDYISGYDRDGNSVERLECQEYTVRGLSYWHDDPDDYQLYISYRDRQSSQYLIYRMDPDSNDELLLRELVLDGYGILRGSFITGEYDPYRWVFMSIVNVSPDAGGDRLDVWQLVDRTDWMELEPSQGTIDPNNSEEFTLTLTTVGIDTGFYEGELVFMHNNTGGETCLPVNLTVVLPNIVTTEEAAYPAEFNIIGAYPNPFNSATNISFSLPEAGHIKLTIHDLQGREVAALRDGSEAAGIHTVSWDASGLASGVYICRLQAGDRRASIKIVMVK